MAKEFSLQSRAVPAVETKYRRITGEFPPPESVEIIEKLAKYEPRAMAGQPPVVWDRAQGFQVFDKSGNRWIDWSSGVVVTNAGHSHPKVVEAIVKQATTGILHNYCFPQERRAELVEKLSALLPEPLKKVFLLTTGSETIECAIKLCRTHGVKVGGRSKHLIVSFEKSFHGRTMGSQQAGGTPALKEWIVNLDKGFIQVPFPDGYRTTDVSFDYFMRCLSEAGVDASNIAGVVMETFPGATAGLAPVEFVQKLRQWCTSHKILYVADEVQAGFGRTGKMWGFEHYGVVPDLAGFGKGISGSLPLSALAGPAHIMDLHPPGSMSSTHTGNPICSAATMASIDVILEEKLVENSARLGKILIEALRALKPRFDYIGAVDGIGLVAAVNIVKPGTKDPDADMAWDIVRRCIEKGLLMFTPVGFGGAAVKICPPLVINEEALREGLGVLEEAMVEAADAAKSQAREVLA
ncbi:MAG: aspartate aminotransferase family protein [Acidobacteria bacterium]|nr:aspartate aminotransferase family protein [Acidobacteriota bacterium]